MRADLHTHSLRSDGLLEPTELVRRAQADGLTCLALTDHDTLAGISEAWAAAAELGVQLIAGVELSVRDREGVEDHLLGFFVDATAPPLVRFLSEMQQERERMAERTLQALDELGLHVSRERVHELASGAVVTRPHIARAMVEAGHVANEQEAFDRYLGSGKPGGQPRPSPDAATAIGVIREAGGVASLAHPVFPRDADAAARVENLPRRLDAMRDAGLAAMECAYPDADAELRERLRALALVRGLIPTGGSDYHGPGKAPYAPLGQPCVDGETVERLRSARPARRGSRI